MTEDHVFDTHLDLSVARMLREILKSNNMAGIMHEDTLLAMDGVHKKLIERYGEGPEQDFARILTMHSFIQGEVMTFCLSMAAQDFLLNSEAEVKNEETLVLEAAEKLAKGVVDCLADSLKDFISEKLNVRNEAIFNDIEKLVKLKRTQC